MNAFRSYFRFRSRVLRTLGVFALSSQLSLAERSYTITGRTVEGQLPVVNGDTSPNEPHLFFGIADVNAPVLVGMDYTMTNTGDEPIRILLRDQAPSCSSPDFHIRNFPSDRDFIQISVGDDFTFSIVMDPTTQFPGGIVTLHTTATDPEDRIFTFPVAGRGNLGRGEVFYRPLGSSERLVSSGDTTPSFAEGTNFGDVLINTPVNDNPSNAFVMKSLTTDPGDQLVIHDATITGPNAADFLLFNLGSNIEQGAEDGFSIRFDPDSVGEKTATLTIETNEPGNSPYTFALRGGGITAPEILVEGRSGGNSYGVITDGNSAHFNNGTAFGEIAVGGLVERMIRITNNGDGDLTFPNPAGASGEFEVIGFPVGPIGPGGSEEFTIKFEPSLPGLQREQIAFSTNIPGIPIFNFEVSGTGVGAGLLMEHLILGGDYVTLPHNASGRGLLGGLNSNVAVVGEPTITGNFRITNTGNADLQINGMSILDPGSEQFAFQGIGNNLVLAEGESQEFSITLDAATAGDTRVSVRFFTNTTPNPYSFGLRAQILEGSEIAFFGRPADGVLTPISSGAALTSLENGTAFFELEEGETSVTSTFSFTNTGENDLLYSFEELTGRDADEFEVIGLGSGTLAPGESQEFTITLTPTSPLNRIAQFHLVTNDPLRRDFTFPLLGNVPPPPEGPPEPIITSFVITGADAEFKFFSEPGTEYQLRHSSSLEGEIWLIVPDVPVINGSTTLQTLQVPDLINPSVPTSFYRIEEVSAP